MGVFGSRENERKKREKRENCKPKTGAVKTVDWKFEKLGLQNVIKWLI